MALWRSGRLYGLPSVVGRSAEVATLWANAPGPVQRPATPAVGDPNYVSKSRRLLPHQTACTPTGKTGTLAPDQSPRIRVTLQADEVGIRPMAHRVAQPPSAVSWTGHCGRRVHTPRTAGWGHPAHNMARSQPRACPEAPEGAAVPHLHVAPGASLVCPHHLHHFPGGGGGGEGGEDRM